MISNSLEGLSGASQWSLSVHHLFFNYTLCRSMLCVSKLLVMLFPSFLLPQLFRFRSNLKDQTLVTCQCFILTGGFYPRGDLQAEGRNPGLLSLLPTLSSPAGSPHGRTQVQLPERAACRGEAHETEQSRALWRGFERRRDWHRSCLSLEHISSRLNTGTSTDLLLSP